MFLATFSPVFSPVGPAVLVRPVPVVAVCVGAAVELWADAARPSLSESTRGSAALARRVLCGPKVPSGGFWAVPAGMVLL